MPLSLSNNAVASLAAGVNNSAVTLTLNTAQGAMFPAVSIAAGTWFMASLYNSGGTIEIVKVTNRTAGSDVLTVIRGQEGTTAVAWNISDQLALRLTAGGLSNFSQGDKNNNWSVAQTFNTALGGTTLFTNNAGGTLSITDGALTVSGGVSVGGNLSVTGNGAVAGTLTAGAYAGPVVTAVNGVHGAVTAVNSVSVGSGLSLTGTGINPTISNTGVLSIGAGAGVALSGSTGGVVVTNTGVLSYNGATGAVSGVGSVTAGLGLQGGGGGAVSLSLVTSSGVGQLFFGGRNGTFYNYGQTYAAVSIDYMNLGLVGSWYCLGTAPNYDADANPIAGSQGLFMRTA